MGKSTNFLICILIFLTQTEGHIKSGDMEELFSIVAWGAPNWSMRWECINKSSDRSADRSKELDKNGFSQTPKPNITNLSSTSSFIWAQKWILTLEQATAGGASKRQRVGEQATAGGGARVEENGESEEERDEHRIERSCNDAQISNIGSYITFPPSGR